MTRFPFLQPDLYKPAAGFASNLMPSAVSTFKIVLNFGSASPRSDL